MTPIITKPLSREEAATIFAENAVFLGKADAIGAHRMVELFGEPAARWIERNTHHGGYLIPGTDYNASGSCAPDDPCLDYYYLSGFLKVVSNHNHRLQVSAHIQSEGGAIWDDVWEERCARLAAQDAQDAAEAVKEANAAVKEAKATAKAASATAAEAEAKRKNRQKKN